MEFYTALAIESTMEAKNTVHRTTIVSVIAAVGIWWVSNTIATIGSKSVMRGADTHTGSSTGLTSAFRDMRWVELTVLQHLVGSVLAVAWVKGSGKSLWPAHAREHKTFIFVAAFGNVVGNVATNAAYALITSSTAQVIKACEPLFTLALTLFLYRNTALDISTLLSVVIIVLGAGAFLMKDATINVWGLVAAMISNTAFPTRNIFLKKLSNIWDNPLQKFAVMSIYSVIFLIPLWLMKVFIISGLHTTRLYESLTSSFFHSTYNLASITVLESVNPVTHSILNISKRLFVIATNIMYFHVPFSFTMFISLLVLLVGCYLYQLKMSSSSKWVITKCLLISAFFLYLLTTLTGINLNTHVACIRDNRISTAWVYDRPIPDTIVSNFQAIAEHNPGLTVHVYCGTTQCLDAVSELRNNRIHVEFAVVSNILKGTSLEQWLAHHPFNKILAGKEFETHLQEAVRLGLLWQYGGSFISPTVRITTQLALPQCQDEMIAWVSEGVNVPEGSSPDVLDVAHFSREHPFIDRLSQLFASKYPTKVSGKSPFKFSFKNLVWELLNDNSCSDCSLIMRNALQLEHVGIEQTSDVAHYGTLNFNDRVKRRRNANIGDEIQGFPGLQFLPFMDHFLDRDNLKASEGKDKITAFLNAWWGDANAKWPPPSNIDPIMLSIHISDLMTKQWEDHRDYLKEREPIGCRDTNTLNFMKKHDVKAFFSGCLTLLMNNPNISGNRNDKIYLVDLNPSLKTLLPTEIQEKGISVQHDFIKGPETFDHLTRFIKAYEFIKNYGEAKLVITQRIHCALPCVAMGTPVIFFNSVALPGGGGTKEKVSSRITGLTPLFHSVDMYKMTKEQGKEWLRNFAWDDPPPNPDVSMTMRLRASAWNIIRKNPSLYDAGRKFGVIPMSPPITSQKGDGVFHLVFTTSSETFIWRHWRCIESILYHYPTSMVIIHSNTLSQSVFNVLTEAGYSIKVQGYYLERLLQGSPAEKFLEKLEEARRSSNWYKNEAGLLCLLMLHQQGGIYMDMDTILVRPIDTLAKNSLGWEDNTNNSLNGAFMIFEKGNSYITSCLTGYAKHFKTKSLGGNEFSSLLTKTYAWHRQDKLVSNNVHVLPYQTFYKIHSGNMSRQCFEDTAGEKYNASMKIIKELVYGVNLNLDVSGTFQGKNEVKIGTVCSYILNTYCVMCSNIH